MNAGLTPSNRAVRRTPSGGESGWIFSGVFRWAPHRLIKVSSTSFNYHVQDFNIAESVRLVSLRLTVIFGLSLLSKCYFNGYFIILKLTRSRHEQSIGCSWVGVADNQKFVLSCINVSATQARLQSFLCSWRARYGDNVSQSEMKLWAYLCLYRVSNDDHWWYGRRVCTNNVLTRFHTLYSRSLQ